MNVYFFFQIWGFLLMFHWIGPLSSSCMLAPSYILWILRFGSWYYPRVPGHFDFYFSLIEFCYTISSTLSYIPVFSLLHGQVYWWFFLLYFYFYSLSFFTSNFLFFIFKVSISLLNFSFCGWFSHSLFLLPFPLSFQVLGGIFFLCGIPS